MLQGKMIKTTPKIPDNLREDISNILGVSIPTSKGISPEVISGYCKLSGDPDSILAEWKIHGAPLGIINDVTPTGIFPPVAPADSTWDPLEDIASDPRGWTNYKSAEESPETIAEILQNMVKEKWALTCTTWAEVVSIVGSDQVTLSKLALISKQKDDGTWKHRIIWDLLRSGVNSRVHQGERIILPRALDVAQDVLDLLKCIHPGEEIWFFGTDVSDAFHQIPLRQDEWRFTVAEFSGKYYVFTVLVFGSASAPTVWGRYAAWLGRSTATIVNPDRLRIQIYVDDPIFTIRGTLYDAAVEVAIALAWIMCSGYPLAWPKSEGGKKISWIGVRYSAQLAPTPSVTISIPEDKIKEALKFCTEALRHQVIHIKTWRSGTGKCQNIANIVPGIKPFCSYLWAALALPTGEDKQPRRRRDWIKVKKAQHGIQWLIQYFSGKAGPIQRTFRLTIPESCWMVISVDASPWGLGGILHHNGTIVKWFADIIQDNDLRILHAERANPSFQTTWEALAILVAVRLWLRENHDGIRIEIRSDSLSALSAAGKASSGSKSVRTILCELALDEADLVGGSCWLTHIPGKANKWPDALSRLHAPTKSSIPIELLTIERTPVVTRDQSFWRSIGKAYMCNHGWWGSRLPSTYVRSGCIAPAASSAPGPGPSPSKVGDVRRFHLQTKRASVFAFV
jgi:hypothetical protein